MSEAAARAWFDARYPADRLALLEQFLAMVAAENLRQNLVAPSTIATMWQRHALDSAQLLRFDPGGGGEWIDIGSGGGFPGIVVAVFRPAPILLVEPRARRADFLVRCVEHLGLDHARVVATKVERVTASADIVSARAVASIDALFTAAQQCTGLNTRWLLPRGRGASADVEAARRSWKGTFHVEQSLVESDSAIVIAEGIQRR